MSTLREKLSLRNPTTRRTLLTGLAFIGGFIVLALIAIQSWEYTNSVAFCSNACHDVHPEEPAAFQDSYHARVKCTECHMGRVSTLEAVWLKASHARHLPAVLFHNYDRPTESETMRPANESCERCHWPPAFHGDTVREIVHYLPDEENTKERTYLILKTSGGERSTGLGYGVHWHIANRVEFIYTDEHKQDVRWVRTTLPDGRTVEYNDASNPLSAQEIAEAEVKLMDCVDCHNRVGHPFPYPERAVDDALADGRINPDLPYAKREMMALLTGDYVDQEAALQAVENVQAGYEATYPEVASAYSEDIEQAAETARQLVKRLIFEEPGVTWKSFPNNGQHKEFPGCFRCHDGKHLSAEGESIRLHCNICHSIPVRVGEGDRPPEMPVVSVTEPASHLDPQFMAEHRFQADEYCATCHGDIEFGTDDSSFCANSACHGQAWPSVELDANFTHPIELTGEHAEVWCHDCHEGVTRPEYDCANCHEPPSQPHFGQTCENCHTPEGFDQVEMEGFEHPVLLEGEHATLDCLACHSAGFELTYTCNTCHEPPSQPHFGQTCENCHTPEGFDQVEMEGFEHPVPLEGEHAGLDCLDCHSASTELSYTCSSCHQPPAEHYQATCDTCHTPEGWAESGASKVTDAPEIPHSLEGMEDCQICHAPDSTVEPAPESHEGYGNEQCLICHQVEDED